jgi:hypothetical protein
MTEIDPHNNWGISQQRLEEHFAAQAATNGDRSYVVGIPLAITVREDGTVVLDFDLSEAYDFEACEEDTVQSALVEDSNLVSRRLQRLRNHHRLTLPVPAAHSIKES